MKPGVYTRVVDLCNRYIRRQKNISMDEAHMFPATTIDVVLIIYRQQYQRHIRRTSHLHRRVREVKKYAAMYRNGRRITEIASFINFSAYLLARILVEHILGCTKKQVSKIMKNVDLIQDERLKCEVSECIEMDEFCSPFVDRIRHTLGLEYEYVLQQHLANARIPFDSEDALRQAGWSKTPDVKLQVPMGVEYQGRTYIVNWIDSKAMFGDPHTHGSENIKQLRGYLNRFGPGMVIYWFGFVSTLNCTSDILLVDSFPENVSVLGQCFVRNDSLQEVAIDVFTNS